MQEFLWKFVSGAYLLGAGVIALAIQGHLEAHPVPTGVGASPLLGLGVAGGAVALMVGCAMAGSVKRASFVVLTLPLLGLLALLFLEGNVRLDASPGKTVNVTVLNKRYVGVRHSEPYIEFRLPGESESKELLVSSATFGRAVVGRTVQITVRDGFFGLRWIER